MIIGHKTIRERLARSIEKNATAQAYLFVGPESVGKFDVAKEFASRLIDGIDGAGKQGDQHPVDLLVLEPEQETVKGIAKERDISADMAREATRFLGSFPYAAQKKVLIIRDAHRLTETAQNTLLKTLEEPPAYAAIILVTHELERVLPTILSRCQQVRFRLVGPSEIEDAVHSHAVLSALPERNRFLIGLGRPGLAIRSCQQKSEFAGQSAMLERLMRISEEPLRERLTLSEACSADVAQTIRLMMWWVGGLHARIPALSSADGALHMRSIEKIEKLSSDLKRFPSSARLLLDTFFMHW